MSHFKRLHGALFSVSYGTIPERTTPGAACVVSAKVIPTAAGRNVIKRRARAALSILLRDAPPVVVALYAKKGIEKASAADIRAEILSLRDCFKIASRP